MQHTRHAMLRKEIKGKGRATDTYEESTNNTLVFHFPENNLKYVKHKKYNTKTRLK